jgi:hypothetical protein
VAAGIAAIGGSTAVGRASLALIGTSGNEPLGQALSSIQGCNILLLLLNTDNAVLRPEGIVHQITVVRFLHKFV